MASHTNKSVHQTKEELLRRITDKKSESSPKFYQNDTPLQGSISQANSFSNSIVNQNMFHNDGNFFARFQAMQQQQTANNSREERPCSSSEESSKKRKLTVSMKVLKPSASSKTVTKPRLLRHDVFENPEDETGNFLLDYHNLKQIGALCICI